MQLIQKRLLLGNQHHLSSLAKKILLFIKHHMYFTQTHKIDF